jgi:hypothetical protein
VIFEEPSAHDSACHICLNMTNIRWKRSKATHRKRSVFFVTTDSIQLKPKAITFEATTETKINLMVSMVPHRRSKYFRAAGTKTIDAMNYRHNESGWLEFNENLTFTSKIEVSTNADVRSVQGA